MLMFRKLSYMEESIYSKEIPALFEEHYRHLLASAISPDVMKEREYRSIFGKSKDLETYGFTSKQRRTGILIPLHGVNGKVVNYILRPDNPRDNGDGKLIKYEQPKGTNVRFDIPPRCLKHLGDPSKDLWIVEGIKKADALASAGADCVIGLTGVWGFKGINDKGGKTIIPDFEHVAWNGRNIFIVFDSDMWSNRHVADAFSHLRNLSVSRESKPHTIRLPEQKDGAKNGADDYLAAGHTLQDLRDLETAEEPKKSNVRRKYDDYTIFDQTGWYAIKSSNGMTEEIPFCNFMARITENIIRDDGQSKKLHFKVIGRLTNDVKENLPPVEVPAGSSFNSLSWMGELWGSKPYLYAGTIRNPKDLVLSNIGKSSKDAVYRTIYTHTGWREIDGELAFLTAAGAVGKKDVLVELPSRLQPYGIPEPNGEDVLDAIRTSIDFMGIGKADILLPLWAEMYLAPLCEILQPTFSLWLYGRSGSFKSVLSALALSHFGRFDKRNLPANWTDTENSLEWTSFLAKDVPFIIDDFAPGQNPEHAKALAAKADRIIRDQGNRQGRARMNKDFSVRTDFYPRGLIIVTGEHEPVGNSFYSRILTVRTEKEFIDTNKLTQAQKKRALYPVAMAHYLLWLKNNWKAFNDPKTGLQTTFESYCAKVNGDGQHPRIPETIAWLFLGLDTGLTFAAEMGAITESRHQELRDEGWRIICNWGADQSDRTEQERPARKFMAIAKVLLNSGKGRLGDIRDDAAPIPVPGTYDIGWKDGDFILLNPKVAYAAVREFSIRTGDYFTWNERAVWDDFTRMNLNKYDEGRNTTTQKIYGRTIRVVKIPGSAFSDDD